MSTSVMVSPRSAARDFAASQISSGTRTFRSGVPRGTRDHPIPQHRHHRGDVFGGVVVGLLR